MPSAEKTNLAAPDSLSHYTLSQLSSLQNPAERPPHLAHAQAPGVPLLCDISCHTELSVWSGMRYLLQLYVWSRSYLCDVKPAVRSPTGKCTLQNQPSTTALSSPAKFVAAPQGKHIASQGHLHRGFVPPHKLIQLQPYFHGSLTGSKKEMV